MWRRELRTPTTPLVDAELSATGVVRWSDEEHLWVAELAGPIAVDE
jgi:hypothetical protein